jgi:hypothetical protein
VAAFTCNANLNRATAILCWARTPRMGVVPVPEKPPDLKDIIEEFQSKQPKKSDNDGENVESHIEKNSVSLDSTRPCISTSK